MDDGSITVIDLQKMEKKSSIDTLKNKGLKPHDIYMLPPWHTTMRNKLNYSTSRRIFLLKNYF